MAVRLWETMENHSQHFEDPFNSWILSPKSKLEGSRALTAPFSSPNTTSTKASPGDASAPQHLSDSCGHVFQRACSFYKHRMTSIRKQESSQNPTVFWKWQNSHVKQVELLSQEREMELWRPGEKEANGCCMSLLRRGNLMWYLRQTVDLLISLLDAEPDPEPISCSVVTEQGTFGTCLNSSATRLYSHRLIGSKLSWP